MTDNTFYVTLLNFKSEQRERNLMSVLMVSALKCHNNHFLHTHPAMSRDHDVLNVHANQLITTQLKVKVPVTKHTKSSTPHS